MLAHKRTPKFWLNLLTGSLMQSKHLVSSKFKIHSIVKNADVHDCSFSAMYSYLVMDLVFPCKVEAHTFLYINYVYMDSSLA